jgi:hypothetical protein
VVKLLSHDAQPFDRRKAVPLAGVVELHGDRPLHAFQRVLVVGKSDLAAGKPEQDERA